ncbi:MAG: hypothetical protein S4CHLAM6_00190 [Chlamydiae bacterium]|nr:hypothetical protein [Chlamydiota bacterium]
MAMNKIKLFAFENYNNEATVNAECSYCIPNEKNSATIAFTKYWKIVLAFNQAHLGRTLIIPNRHFGTYEVMTESEAKEYSQIFKQFLPALQKTFQVSCFNVLYMMNWSYNPEKQHPAFLDGKPNPHFHWHIIPRYDSPRQFGTETFEDLDFGNPFDHYRCKKLDFETHKKLLKEIQMNLDIEFLDTNN